MKIPGIDPGIHGGLAIIDVINGAAPQLIDAIDVPIVGVKAKERVDALGIRAWIEAHKPIDHAAIERAGSMPKQGVASTFKYGAAYGALRTTVALCNIPYRLVTPGKWKAHFHLDADKEKSRALAIQLWPGCGYFALKKHHARAEAALIARYGAETIATKFAAPSGKGEATARYVVRKENPKWVIK